MITRYLFEDGSILEEWTEFRDTRGKEAVILHHRIIPGPGQDPLDNQATDAMVDRRETWREQVERYREAQEAWLAPGGGLDRMMAGFATVNDIGRN